MAFDKIKLPSNEYSDWLIRQAMERGACIVIMRSKRAWLERIPELAGYDKLITLNSPQSVYLSPGNMSAKDWDLLKNSL